MKNKRIWVSLTQESIIFCRDKRSGEQWRGVTRKYKATPRRVWRVLCASSKYTVYKA